MCDNSRKHFTVNSDIFARVLFSLTSHMQSFINIKFLRKGEINQSFTDIGNLCPSRDFLTSQICLLTLFKKKSEFTVLVFCSCLCSQIKSNYSLQLQSYLNKFS